MVETLAQVQAANPIADHRAAVTIACARAAIVPNAQLRAIVDSVTKQFVGIVVTGYSLADGRWWLYDLVIAPQFGRRGYGRATIAALVAEHNYSYAIQQLYTDYSSSNHVAAQFLAALGWSSVETDAAGIVTAALPLPQRVVPNATITLRPITLANARACLALTVAPHQTKFVASTAASLVQSRFEPNWLTQAIYADQTMVGFVMYGHDPVYGWGILRLLVDAQFQGCGYGRKALQQVIEAIRAAGGTTIGVSYEDANHVARRLYQSLGFVETAEQPFGEPFAVLNLANAQSI